MTDSIIFIIDRSASIQPFVENYVNAINGILKNLDPKTLLTVALFNASVSYPCVNMALNRLETPISTTDIVPNGPTAFYDNVSAIIGRLMAFFKNNQQKPPIVIILTDGEDTCSRLINVNQMALRIAMAKAKGWQFVYLGVTENSVKMGRYIGCNACVLYNTTAKSFLEIPNVLGKLLADKNIPEIDLDIRDLSDSLSNVRIS